MLIDVLIEISVNSRFIKYYENLGYIIPTYINKQGKTVYDRKGKLLVKQSDFQKQSNKTVSVLCDYCGVEYKISLDNRYKYFENGIIHKDSCLGCFPKKVVESNMLTYSVENVMHVNSFKEKMFETNIKKYGVKSPIQNPDVLEKMSKTSMIKYGVKYHISSSGVRTKSKAVFMKKYGVENPMQSKDVQEKTRNTNILKFGFPTPCQNRDIMEKVEKTNLDRYGNTCSLLNKDVAEKSRISMYNNGTQQCSNQQKFIHNIIGGHLNYPCDRLNLDIAFPEEMIYVEYDGGGHDLNVTLGGISRESFNTKETKRYLFLKSLGWRMIKFISPKDYLPTKEKILELFNDAKSQLCEDLHHVNILFDKNLCNYSLAKI